MLVARLVVKGNQAHRILLPEHQVGKRCRQLLCVLILADSARPLATVSHRSAAVDQQRAAEVGFFLEFADVQAIAFAKY